jgi:hypothetical protein
LTFAGVKTEIREGKKNHGGWDEKFSEKYVQCSEKKFNKNIANQQDGFFPLVSFSSFFQLFILL